MNANTHSNNERYIHSTTFLDRRIIQTQRVRQTTLNQMLISSSHTLYKTDLKHKCW